MIQFHSRHAALWRCLAVLRLVAHIAATEPQPLRLIPLKKISAWVRGQEPVWVAEGETVPRVLRFTLDLNGINSLERLEGWPKDAGEQSTHSAFIVGREYHLSEYLPRVLYKNGHVRLGTSDARSPKFPAVWNTPMPPKDLKDPNYPSMYGGYLGTHFYYATNMDKIRGITFFFTFGRLCGIHVHNDQDPSSSALAMYASLFPPEQGPGRTVAWIYLPLPKDDRAVGLGLRTGQPGSRCSILVQTERGGSFAIGSEQGGQTYDSCLAASGPITMFHGKMGQPWDEPVFGAYCKNAPMFQGNDENDFLESFASASSSPRTSPTPNNPSFPSYFSWAPLDGVRSAQVFQVPDSGRCRGIIFRYRNGGARAVGECRVGVDPVRLTTEPMTLYFRTEVFLRDYTVNLKRSEIKFGQTGVPMDGWEQTPMRGRINFWFTPLSSEFTVE